jgi:hypothetical protein
VSFNLARESMDTQDERLISNNSPSVLPERVLALQFVYCRLEHATKIARVKDSI